MEEIAASTGGRRRRTSRSDGEEGWDACDDLANVRDDDDGLSYPPHQPNGLSLQHTGKGSGTPTAAMPSTSSSPHKSPMLLVKGRSTPSDEGGYITRGRRSRLRRHSLTPDPFSSEQPAEERGAPLVVEVRQDLKEEGYSYAQLWRIRFSLVSPMYIALKTALLVTLPLCILVFGDATKAYFRAGALVAVVGTANTKLYLGQQLSGTVIVLQGAVWMMLWGSILTALGVQNHESAWWGLAFASVILVSFLTNFRSRRLLMSYGIIIMQIMRQSRSNDLSLPASVAGDVILALGFAAFQAFVPFPLLMSRRADEVFRRAWKQIASICVELRDGVWSGRSLSANVAAAETACDELGAVVATIPGLLFFVSYEPFERSLYNQLRNERLTLLKRMLVILNATCTGARFFTSMSSTETRAAQLQWKKILSEPVDDFLRTLTDAMTELGASLEPSVTVRRCPFEALQEKKEALLHALQSCRAFVARGDAETVDAPAFYSFLYFHLLLALQADELHTFGEQLAAFRPERYKSTWRRCLEFFLLDFWEDFRCKLLGRVLLRTKVDRRNFKEALKLACAYCIAAFFTTELNSDNTANTYYFGMSIILGMGLPTVSESIEVGVHRIAGMAFATAIGYVAKWKTSNFVQEIALVVCGSFVALCFRSSTRYLHVAWYASFIAPSAYSIATNRITMIARVVDCSFAVSAYFVLCTVMFPINPYRVLWNILSDAEKRMADTITILASMLSLPVTADVMGIAQARLALAAEKVKGVKELLGQSRQWILICVKEPSLIGKPFPTETMQHVQLGLQHTAAGLEVWLFGLQLLYRARAAPLHALILNMMDAVRPLLVNLEVASRVIFQDLIDAVVRPLDWTLAQSVQRLSDFVAIKGQVDATFNRLHKDMSLTQDRGLRWSMMNRGERETAEGMVNRSIIAQSPDNVCFVHDCAENGGEMKVIYPDVRGGINSPQTEDGEAITWPVGAGPIALAAPLNRSFNLSFRAPQGNLPIDVDVTAFTILFASVATLTESLEKLVPPMKSINTFMRSRHEAGRFTLRDFFWCKT